MNAGGEEPKPPVRRMRLVPPKLRVHTAEAEDDAEARAWARHLHHKRRTWAIILLGNAALLLGLVGGPFVRGRLRARATWVRHAEFVSCLLGPKPAQPPGLGPAHHEAELFAAKALGGDAGWPARCRARLEAVAPESALFVLPSVKLAEERVREAARVMGVELRAMAGRAVGEALPDRPLRALAQLRDEVRALSEAANIVDVPRHPVLDAEARAELADAAHLPMYAGRDAVVTLWGDDRELELVAVDRTGVSYLDARAGHPFRRARLARPSALRGIVHRDGRALLVWATPEARCRERASGCYGKTSSVAALAGPLFTLPTPRLVAAHVAGRADRSVAALGSTLTLAAQTDDRRVRLERFRLAADAPFDPALPALEAQEVSAESYDDLLVLATAPGSVGLGSVVRDGEGVVELLAPGAAPRTVASLPGRVAPAVFACAAGERLRFAAVDGQSLIVGDVAGGVLHTFARVALASKSPLDPEQPAEDAVTLACDRRGALVLARTAERALIALRCQDGAPACDLVPLAANVHHAALLATDAGALVAYAGDEATPQIFVRSFDFASGRADAPRVPSPCWVRARGLCGQPWLVQLGARTVLAAREGTDLAVVESADAGRTWSTPPVF